MASLSSDHTGNRTIQLMCPDGKRRSIRLGKTTKKLAEAIRLKVEGIHAARVSKMLLDSETAAWVAGICDDLAQKLAAVGLIVERKSEALGGFLAGYIDRRRADSKGGTVINLDRVAGDLIAFYGADTPLRDITEKRADQFRTHYLTRAPKLAGATVHRRLKTARQFFAFALRMVLIGENPFQAVSAPNALPAEKRHYVSVADTERLLQECNPVWRAIVALARYGGLRCPNEVLSLRWEDINFATGRRTVTAHKTDGYESKGTRVVPLFPRLRAVLDEAWELAPAGAVYVVGGDYRAKSLNGTVWNNVNLRTQFEKLVRRAGLKPWPRPFNNLRASCETDLTETFPGHVAAEWIGHSPAVAATHYLTVRESDIERAATGSADSGAVVVQNQVQTGVASGGHAETKKPEPLAGVRVGPILSELGDSSSDDQLTLWGFEPQYRP